ncbi:hypothetical protein Metal_3074 [Methylomicrobium album BG8]|uniref:Large polyvalent protein associated domain-containing protein n=1 Tax=Methylomicrobium album BG8 TaxID=686340 RepID=H8GN40_METAL|nr:MULTISPECIES: hypothetical protein [Methylomicrobium]EIC30754.1 hypothetical protein Metal_3074 [Methylomicrobium album BG8]
MLREHYHDVKRALEYGEPVSREVLNDYPDLAAVADKLKKMAPVSEDPSNPLHRDAASSAENEGGIKFSRAIQDDLAFAQEVLNELAEVDEFFRFPVSPKTTLDGVMKDIAPDFEFVGEDTREDERSESGADRRFVFKTDKGKPFYVYERGDEIWIDVSRLSTGEGGAAIYHALGNYAHNADKVFVGDPAGLSDDAVIRRTANMLSLALRLGTTDFMEPSIEQRRGIPEIGVVPLKWQGSDVDKTQSLIQTFLANLQKSISRIIRIFSMTSEKDSLYDPLTDNPWTGPSSISTKRSMELDEQREQVRQRLVAAHSSSPLYQARAEKDLEYWNTFYVGRVS